MLSNSQSPVKVNVDFYSKKTSKIYLDFYSKKTSKIYVDFYDKTSTDWTAVIIKSHDSALPCPWRQEEWMCKDSRGAFGKSLDQCLWSGSHHPEQMEL